MKKLIPVLLAVIALFCLCGISVSAAEDVSAYAVGGYADTKADVFAPAGAAVRMFDISISDWSIEGDRQRKRHREEDGRICMMCELPTSSKAEEEGGFLGYTSFLIELDEHPGSRQTLVFGICIDGSEASVPVNIEVTAVTESISARVHVLPGEWNLVYMDAQLLDSRITGMRVMTEYGEDVPRSVSMTKPYLTRNRPAGLKYAERVAANQWTDVAGRSQIKTGWICPDENDRAEITAPLVSPIRRQAGTTVYFEIRLTDVISGNMTLGILYEGASEEQREYQRKISLNASDGVYTVPVKADAEIVSYSLRFDNIKCAGDGMYVDAISVYGEGKSPIEGSSDLGRVESITRRGSSVIFSGTMERSAAAEYDDSMIRFYAIPGWCADDLSFAVELGSIKMTTRYQYTADLAALGASSAADTFRFFAGIDTESGMVPLSHPRYTDAVRASVSGVSNMGVYGGEAVGVFESNASHVMVEVPLDQMVLGSGGMQIPYTLLGAAADSGTFSAGGTRTLRLNEELLRKLDSEIDFYISAGIRVYLRLTASSPVRGLTYGGKNALNYAVRATDNEARQMYAALIRTLCSRWNEISGIALGRSVNYSGLVGDTALDSAAVYASDLAEVCRITYNAASVYVPEVMVIVPYVEYMTDDTDASKWIADRTMAVMLADRLDEMGSIPWVLMYCVDAAEDDLTSPVTLSRMLTDLELESPSGLMVFWQPNPEELSRKHTLYSLESGQTDMEMSQYIAMKFGQLCADCTSFRARAVFLSMVNLPSGADYTFYEHLKKESAGDSGRFIYEKEADDTRILTEHDAVVSLWDFSESHHTMGWIASGGISSCLTDYSALFSEADPENSYVRVLRADVAQNSGITLCNFDSTLDFTGIEGMDFTVAVQSPVPGAADAGATLVFVIGTEDTRAEYTAENVEYGEIRSFHCGFEGYDYLKAIDYVGVMIYADREVYLDIGEVHVHSSKMTQEEIAAVFGDAEPEETVDKDAYRLALILCAVTVVMSVAAITAITRHENEAEEKRSEKQSSAR